MLRRTIGSWTSDSFPSARDVDYPIHDEYSRRSQVPPLVSVAVEGAGAVVLTGPSR